MGPEWFMSSAVGMPFLHQLVHPGGLAGEEGTSLLWLARLEFSWVGCGQN